MIPLAPTVTYRPYLNHQEVGTVGHFYMRRGFATTRLGKTGQRRDEKQVLGVQSASGQRILKTYGPYCRARLLQSTKR